MSDVMTHLKQRNQEIGSMLREARERKHIPVTRCADLVSTSRRRYTAMENGEATIGVAELEVLMDFLEIRGHEIWGMVKDVDTSHQVVVEAQPGETVQIVVAIQK